MWKDDDGRRGQPIVDHTGVYDDGRNCTALQLISGYSCTLPRHVDGYPHMAGDGTHIIGIWWEEGFRRRWGRERENRLSWTANTLFHQRIPAPRWPPDLCRATHSVGGTYCTMAPHPMGYPHIATGLGKVLTIWWESELH